MMACNVDYVICVQGVPSNDLGNSIPLFGVLNYMLNSYFNSMDSGGGGERRTLGADPEVTDHNIGSSNLQIRSCDVHVY